MQFCVKIQLNFEKITPSQTMKTHAHLLHHYFSSLYKINIFIYFVASCSVATFVVVALLFSPGVRFALWQCNKAHYNIQSRCSDCVNKRNSIIFSVSANTIFISSLLLVGIYHLVLRMALSRQTLCQCCLHNCCQAFHLKYPLGIVCLLYWWINWNKRLLSRSHSLKSDYNIFRFSQTY